MRWCPRMLPLLCLLLLLHTITSSRLVGFDQEEVLPGWRGERSVQNHVGRMRDALATHIWAAPVNAIASALQSSCLRGMRFGGGDLGAVDSPHVGTPSSTGMQPPHTSAPILPRCKHSRTRERCSFDAELTFSDNDTVTAAKAPQTQKGWIQQLSWEPRCGQGQGLLGRRERGGGTVPGSGGRGCPEASLHSPKCATRLQRLCCTTPHYPAGPSYTTGLLLMRSATIL